MNALWNCWYNGTSSDELSCGSEEPEISSNEELIQGSVSSESEESEQDPYDDCDGEYGSDTNYIPNEDSRSSTTHVSHFFMLK